MIASSASRALIMWASVSPSTFNRSRGSVFEARTLNQNLGPVRVMPSNSSTSKPFPSSPYSSRIAATAAGTSLTSELISPLAEYRLNGFNNEESDFF